MGQVLLKEDGFHKKMCQFNIENIAIQFHNDNQTVVE